MTQMQEPQKGVITREMEAAAIAEGVAAEVLRAGLADGTVVLPANPNHKRLEPCAIGRGLRTKVNANIGTSQDFPDAAAELCKL